MSAPALFTLPPSALATTPSGLVALALALSALSGLPGLLWRPLRERTSTLLLVVASVVGVVGALGGAFGDASYLDLAWDLPVGKLALRVDALSAVFLLPVFLVSGLGAVYGEGYFAELGRNTSTALVRALYGLLVAAIALVLVARDGVLFLMAWEVMALAALFLVLTEHEKAAAREAGLVYMVATHAGTLALFALFILLGLTSGSSELAELGAGKAATGVGTACFLLGLVGFGVKAGVMPLHVWLPPAHAAAPSPVSALMSGVMIKTGIYGLLRLLSLFPDPPLWWGGTLFVLGLISAIGGVAFALGQHDVKRLLAYHSVENIGIIVMGIGLGAAGRSLGQPSWVALGTAAALLHVVNHALFKSLLFFGAGSVIHATGTREMDELGGLLKVMPWTGLSFLIAAIAISGLPPLNGFVSEWLLYLGMLDTLGPPNAQAGWLGGSLALPGLALVGALALACFVKAFGAMFLGLPRSDHAKGAHEASRWMLVPMSVGALLCVAIGLAPGPLAPLLDSAVHVAASDHLAPPLVTLAPFRSLTLLGLVLILLVALITALARFRVRAVGARRAGTWDCGYAAPSARMQYTSSSFADWLVGLFGWLLRPNVDAPKLGLGTRSDEPERPTAARLFPARASFASSVPDVALDRAVMPVLHRLARASERARWLHQGRVQAYLVYIAVTLVVLLTRV